MLLLLLTAVVSVAVGLAAYGAKLFKSVELSTVDTRFSVRGTEKPPSDLVVVGVDAETLQALNLQWPYPRRLHGQVIDKLREDGAKVIAFDVVFAEPSKEKQKLCPFFGADFQPNDCALATAAAKAKNVIFSSTEVRKGGEVKLFGASSKQVLPVLKAHAGYTGIADDVDGSERRFLYDFSGLRSFAVAAVEKETGKKISRE